MTNADVIRSMTDSGLASAIGCPLAFNGGPAECPDGDMTLPFEVEFPGCLECRKKWLKEVATWP